MAGQEFTAYKSLVGSMSWFASSLRWDCVHAVSRLQMGMHEPTRGMMGAAMRVAAYIGQTQGFRLGGARAHEANAFEFYTDSVIGHWPIARARRG